MNSPIRILIFEDHQPTVDGYYYRLSPDTDFDIIGAVHFGEDLTPKLKEVTVDVLLLDISAPVSKKDPTPYPVFMKIVNLRKIYPDLKILIISMHGEKTLIDSALKVGVNGYILKDDGMAIQNLGDIIRSIMNGGSYLSQNVLNKFAGDNEYQISLSPRQLQVLSMCASNPNLTKGEIARQLNIADSTVRNLLTSVYQRLEVRNLTAAVEKARALRIISPYPPTYHEKDPGSAEAVKEE